MLHSVKHNTIWFLFEIPDALTLLTGDLCNVWHDEDYIGHILHPVLGFTLNRPRGAFFKLNMIVSHLTMIDSILVFVERNDFKRCGQWIIFMV